MSSWLELRVKNCEFWLILNKFKKKKQNMSIFVNKQGRWLVLAMNKRFNLFVVKNRQFYVF
jgi:hypothetical protein